VEWVSSQNGMLIHANTKIFISHCGINSAFETVLLSGGHVRLLCLPLFGDQLDMAMRVQDAGVGLWLNKLSFTAAQIKASIAQLMDNSFVERGKLVQKTIEMAGGTKKAVDWIEYAYIARGASILTPPDQLVSEWASNNLDCLAMHVLIWMCLYYIITSCCACRCCKSTATKDSKVKTS
jgi:hypothetical protein